MFLVGFICGVVLMTFLTLLCDAGEDRMEDVLAPPARQEMQTSHDWQKTRNFLYYDGTEMPLKKEEFYE